MYNDAAATTAANFFLKVRAVFSSRTIIIRSETHARVSIYFLCFSITVRGKVAINARDSREITRNVTL